MSAPAASPRPRRTRRLPAEAEREILDAAELALGECPFRELSVEGLMARTGMTRSSFYHYYRSLDDVAVALLRRVQEEMAQAALPWMGGDPVEDPVRAIRRGIHAVAAVYAKHGPVLAAIHEASYQHESVMRAWREGVLEEWVRAITERLRVQREVGVTPVDDPDEIVRALLLMNTAVFIERLGSQPPDPPEAVAETLSRIWVAAIYPQAVAAGR
jgi:AcrR family transcriptional regulator